MAVPSTVHAILTPSSRRPHRNLTPTHCDLTATPSRARQGRPIEFTVTLSGDSFVPSVGEEDFGLGATSALLSGIRSSQNEALGFNAIVVPRLSRRHVTRLSEQVVRLDFPPVPEYDIREPET